MNSSHPPVTEFPNGSLRLLLERARNRHVVPFVGAGISANLIPTWKVLIQKCFLIVFVGSTEDDFNKVLKENSEDLTILTDLIKRKCAPLSFETLTMRVIVECLKEKMNKVVNNTSMFPKPTSSSSSTSSKHTVNNRPKPLITPTSAVIHSSTTSSSASDFLSKIPNEVWEDVLTTPSNMPYTQSRSSSSSSGVSKGGENRLVQFKLEAFLSQELNAQKCIVTGPWAAILTTNWDSFLEVAWKTLTDTASGRDVEYMRRLSWLLPVRYRSDVSQFFAELRSELLPPRVFKLHGDFTAKGLPEFVSDHSDYRRLIVRDISSLSMLRYMSTTYSFLFYGYSLQDRDLLGILDEIVETLGVEAGPHFWITADKVSEHRQRYLLNNYCIHTIKVADNDFAAQLDLLKFVCEYSWQLPKDLSLSSLVYQFKLTTDIVDPLIDPLASPLKVSVSSPLPPNSPSSHMRNRSLRQKSLSYSSTDAVFHHNDNNTFRVRIVGGEIPEWLLENDISAALAIPVGISRLDVASFGKLMSKILTYSSAIDFLDKNVQKFNTSEENWRAKEAKLTPENVYPFRTWMVGSHTCRYKEKEEEHLHSRACLRRSLFQAVEHFIFKAILREGEIQKDNNPEWIGGVLLCMPVLATGYAMLYGKEAFSIQLSAIGYCISQINKKIKKIPSYIDKVEVILSVNDTGLLCEISSTFKVGSIIARAIEERMEFTAMYVKTDSTWTSRRVRLGIKNSNCKELRLSLGNDKVFESTDENSLLFDDLGVTEGCILLIGQTTDNNWCCSNCNSLNPNATMNCLECFALPPDDILSSPALTLKVKSSPVHNSALPVSSTLAPPSLASNIINTIIPSKWSSTKNP